VRRAVGAGAAACRRARVVVAAALAVGGWTCAAVAASSAAAPLDRYPGVAAAYAVAANGRLIWGAAIDAHRQPASIAKLLTALVLLEGAWDPDAVIEVRSRAAEATGSRIGLRRGERLRAADALTAMLVRSANDACLALVEHAAADVAAFRPKLAARAAALGMTDSNFVDPCGYDAPGQYTTVRDLLRLADAARRVPEIALRARAVDARIRTLAGREFRFTNTNLLIGRATDATGLKSGYTNGAGRSLIALGERGDDRAVVVMLGATGDRWLDASGVLAHALARASELRKIESRAPAR
jgi:D-alanyl-D-alanine carboxypeptidase (penicillin-binding protein 5/6)